MNARPVEIENLNFSYNGGMVLENVNLALDPQDFACVVGPNGGGKTTLLRLILGLLQPRSGSVKVFGEPPARMRHRIGYVAQHSRAEISFPLRVADVVLLGRLRPGKIFSRYTKADRQAAKVALEEVELMPLQHRAYGELSGGERQRVLIARALAIEPDLLLLDEPTANVDIKVERELHDLLQYLNKRLPIMMVTHDLGFVSSYVSKVICVNRLVKMHPTSEITGEIISEMYGTDVRMVRHDQPHPTGGCPHV